MNTDKSSSQAVAITGIGVVSPYGAGADIFWREIVAGNHAFAPIKLFNTDEHRTKVAAEIRRMPDLRAGRLDKDILSRCDVLALIAASEALGHARLLNESTGGVLFPADIGIIAGTAAGGILGVERFFRARATGEHNLSPLPMISSFCLSSIATNIAKEFCIEGPRLTTATVCSSSGLALAAAMEMIQTGEVKTVLVVGAETLSEVGHAGFNSLRSIAPDRCRPFDLNRKGLILGEGAGAMVLERPSAARRRNAKILSYLVGYGLTTDVHHFTAPEPEGEAIKETIIEAIRDAGIDPDQINYVNAHGTGTKLNDSAETLGLKKALGAQAYKMVVSSTKSLIGHQMGAASILEAIATVISIQNGIIHPTANLETPDPECDLDYVSEGSRHIDIDWALSNSFAFGGSNISLVFSKDKPRPDMTVPESKPSATRPVITGIGIVSPTGIGKDAFLQAIEQEKSGIRMLESLGDQWANFYGGLVDYSIVHAKTPSGIRRRLNRQTSFLYLAFNEAMEDAGINISDLSGMPIAYGTAFGCSGNVHRFYSQLLKDGPRMVSPMEFNMSVTNAPPSLLAQEFGLKAQVWVLVGDEASWDISLIWAAKLIESGKADRVAVCAAEELNDPIMAIHHGLGLLKTGDQPGIIPGEGALCMVIESEETAHTRNAKIYGAIDSFHSIQDAMCGPQDYSKDGKHIIEAAKLAISSLDGGRDRLLCIGPENGSPTIKDITGEVTYGIKNAWGGPVEVFNIRSFVGESGLSGGLGLAAGILAGQTGQSSHIITLTCARGGVNTATIVGRKDGSEVVSPF
ncbi:putative Beta-ketoacyl-(acyl-carrier-protein) synthase II [uncultured Desulfobacterium sp.]|uniref:Putative Beta-ketoacyl-(Acyl-carrier-protein) synthase II n=1 Tax=uncultured Desulfobacterium sp. TaxID=201089 RepID=A0A445N1S0_9BACT|nr:putative Beta-ketoacyl-(acyl-carrier-protein) synthase II [uncultured Desulfobacterium sp.]